MTTATRRRIGNQRPRLSSLPKRRTGSSGPDACEFAESLGYNLDDWQRWCVDGMLSEDGNARLCATLTLLLVPRQNGKNVVLEIVELYAFYVLGWDAIVHTAHRQDTSADHMARLRSVIEANPDLDAITQFIVANGKERIVRTDTRAEIRFMTRSKKIGRGRSPKLVVFDEALYVTDDQLQAIVPSMSAQSLGDDQPLMILASSAPLAESVVLHRIRTACVVGMDDAFFAEWSSEAGTDPADRDAWYQSNPGLGLHIGEPWIEQNELRILSPQAFAIERLGIISDVDEGSRVISTSAWRACLDTDPSGTPVDPSAIALDVSPERAWASIAVAGRRPDGHTHLEVVARQPGTGWIVEVAGALHAAHRLPLRVDKRSPAAGLIVDLVAAGVPVTEADTAEVVRACARIQDAIMNERVRHVGQEPLDSAVANAEIRPVGDGGWIWSRRSSSIDITSLMAVTVAYGAASDDPRKPVFAY